MEVFLRKIKLIQNLSTELDIPKDVFVAKLKEQMDDGGVSWISDLFNELTSQGNEYIGYIGGGYFQVKIRRRPFHEIESIAVAQGTYKQEDNRLIIKTEINGFKGIMKPIFRFLLFFYPIVVIIIFSNYNPDGMNTVYPLPFLLISGLLTFGVLLLVMRISVDRLKDKLERELFSLS